MFIQPNDFLGIKQYINQFIPKNESGNIRKVTHPDLEEIYPKFKVFKSKETHRFKRLELSQKLVDDFLKIVEKISVTDLEYVASYRFFLAHIMDELSDNTLGKWIRNILQDRSKGAFILSIENFKPDAEKEFDKILKIQTAISFMFGKANLDSMSGLYYARFTVKLNDDSDSHLRKFQDRLTLHNDGTFVNELTDYVLMTKLVEKNVEEGNSLLLHLDDWEDLNVFYQHHLCLKPIKFSAPPSKNTHYSVHHPVFYTDSEGRPCMAYIDQFSKPQTSDEGMYLYSLSQSLESSKNVLGFELPVGCSIICNNHFWLHGRDKFLPKKDLCRELMRQRGVFFKNLVQQPYPDSMERI